MQSVVLNVIMLLVVLLRVLITQILIAHFCVIHTECCIFYCNAACHYAECVRAILSPIKCNILYFVEKQDSQNHFKNYVNASALARILFFSLAQKLFFFPFPLFAAKSVTWGLYHQIFTAAMNSLVRLSVSTHFTPSQYLQPWLK